MNATRKPMSTKVRLALTMTVWLAVAAPQVFAQGVRAGTDQGAQPSTPPAVALPSVALPASAAIPAAPTRTMSGESARATQASRAARVHSQPEQGVANGRTPVAPCVAGGGAPSGTADANRCN